MCGACVIFIRLISPNSAAYLALKVLIYDVFFFILCTQQALCMTQLNVCFFFIINNISDARVSIRQKKEVQAETDTQTKFPFTILILDNVFFFFLDDLLNVHSSALL